MYFELFFKTWKPGYMYLPTTDKLLKISLNNNAGTFLSKGKKYGTYLIICKMETAVYDQSDATWHMFSYGLIGGKMQY